MKKDKSKEKDIEMELEKMIEKTAKLIEAQIIFWEQVKKKHGKPDLPDKQSKS